MEYNKNSYYNNFISFINKRNCLYCWKKLNSTQLNIKSTKTNCLTSVVVNVDCSNCHKTNIICPICFNMKHSTTNNFVQHFRSCLKKRNNRCLICNNELSGKFYIKHLMSHFKYVLFNNSPKLSDEDFYNEIILLNNIINFDLPYSNKKSIDLEDTSNSVEISQFKLTDTENSYYIDSSHFIDNHFFQSIEEKNFIINDVLLNQLTKNQTIKLLNSIRNYYVTDE